MSTTGDARDADVNPDPAEGEHDAIDEADEAVEGEYTAGNYPEGDVREDSETSEGGYTAGNYPEGDRR